MNIDKAEENLRNLDDDTLNLLGLTRPTIRSMLERFGYKRIGGYLYGLTGIDRVHNESAMPTVVFVDGVEVKNVIDHNVDDGWVLSSSPETLCHIFHNGVVTVKDWRSGKYSRSE